MAGFSALSDAAQGSILAGGSSGVNALLGFAGARLSYKYNKRLMAKQNQYAIDAFNRENERQDYLLANQGAITRNALVNAGYSGADPSGLGAAPAANSMQPPSNPSMSPVNFGKIDLLQANVLANQAKLIGEQAENQKIKNKYEERRQEGEVGVIENDLQKYKETFNEQVNTIKSQYYNLTKQNRLLDAQVDNYAASTAGLQVAADFDKKTFDDRADSIKVTLDKLSHERDIAKWTAGIKEVENNLAQAGILNGQNWLQSLISVVALGKGTEATNAISSFIREVIAAASENLPEIIGSLVGGVISSVVNAPSYIIRGLTNSK